ncbi:MAG: hypothetical protein ABGZ35_14085 [Planctomycetaceae bacterium]
MARMTGAGITLEFSRPVKSEAFRLNLDNAPRGCVGYWCEWCFFSNVQQRWFHVDHLVPASRMEEFRLSVAELTSIRNACVLCKACNASKLNFDSPRHGVGLAFRAPNINLTHGERRHQSLNWDALVQMAMRKGPYRRGQS